VANTIISVDRYNIPKDGIEYYFVLDDTIPEVGLQLSFRRSGQRRTRPVGVKEIKCPHCSVKLTETAIDTKITIHHKPTRLTEACQFHMKCSACKNSVGITIIYNLSK